MSGSKFSTSRGTVIYVATSCSEFGPDALRYFIAVAGPENQDTDFTWDEFVRRTNFELANEWGNLVNRSISMAHNNVGAIPKPGAPADADHELLAVSRAGFDAVGELLGRNRFKQAVGEAMRVVTAANRYLSDQEPWKRKDDPDRRDTILHTALQVVQDANTLLTPFLPHSAQQVHEALGGAGVWAAQPEIRTCPTSATGRTTRCSPATTRASRRAGRPRRSRSAARWRSPRRSSPSSTRSWARPVRTGHPSGDARRLVASAAAARLPSPAGAGRWAAGEAAAAPRTAAGATVDAHTHLDACGCVTRRTSSRPWTGPLRSG